MAVKGYLMNMDTTIHRSQAHSTYRAGWGKLHPADFVDGGEMNQNQKWFHWTPSNDLASKKYMRNGLYLVRCRSCGAEKMHPTAVYICPEEECLRATAILLEIVGHDLIQDETGDWFSPSQEFEELDDEAQNWWTGEDTAEA